MSTHLSLQRANAILREFTEAKPTLTVGEISRRLDLHKSTVSRILKALLDDGMVWHNAETGRYSLGMTLIEMAGVALGQIDVRSAAMPHMGRLAVETDETISVAVRRDRETVTVAHIPSTHSIRHVLWIGRRLPLRTTASGKALLAAKHARGETWENLIGDEVGLTSGWKTGFEADLGLIAKRGYADESDEFEAGTAAIAAPIVDRSGAAVAALSVSGPSARFDTESRKKAVPWLLKITKAIAVDLGAHHLPDLVASHQ